MLFEYHNTPIREGRLAEGKDHCASGGRVYRLADLVVDGHISGPEWVAALVVAQLTEDQPVTVIYAVSEGHRIHVAIDGRRGTPDAVKHETLFHNAPVLAAGELRVMDGVVIEVNDLSGSYGTGRWLLRGPGFAAAILDSLGDEGVVLAEDVGQRLRSLAKR